MRLSEAPRPGWYPDPEGGARLRWWDGGDWSDRWRARPSISPYVPPGPMEPSHPAGHLVEQGGQFVQQYAGQNLPGNVFPGQVDPAQVIAQVRQATRDEAQRASQLFGAQARSVAREVAPLISEYTTKVTRVLRFLATIAIVLLVLWVLFQVFAQQSMFDWLGDRIDNLTDQGSGAVLLTRR